MIITRKIQVFVYDTDVAQKKEYIHTLYSWRDLVRRGANMIVAHKFAQQNIRDFVYLKDEIKDKFYVKDILKEGKGMSEQNTTYRLLSEMMKGKVPSDIFSCLNQSVAHTFKETEKDMIIGKASVEVIRTIFPMPFSAKSLSNIHWDETDKRFYFTLFGIPFGVALGRDRSNNQVVIERCISGEYKLCSSSLQIDDAKNKMFLLLCVDIPKKEIKLIKGKTLFAFLGVFNPIVYTTDVNVHDNLSAIIQKNKLKKQMQILNSANDYSLSKDFSKAIKEEKELVKSDLKKYVVYTIGNEEEFNHRRRQIQEAVKRCQINNRYSVGGKGRKRKCQAIERWHDKENNYVDTKLHTYSRMLVDAAVKYKCDTIYLMKQEPREIKAKDDNQKGEPFMLRNWSYFGLKTKIEYKAKQYGIVLKEDKSKEKDIQDEQ
jgi:hypothetical protein